MRKLVLQKAVVAILVLLLSPSVVSATTYYVRTDGNNGNTGLGNTAGEAWRTIDYAADNVAAGDTIRVQAGTYSEAVSPGDAGTSGNPITFVADGAVTFCTLTLSDGDNYLRFIGFTIDTDAGSCTKAQRAVNISNASTTTGVEFWNNTIRDSMNSAIGSGTNTTRANNWILVGNTIRDNGAGGAIAVQGADLYVAYNTLINNDPDEFIGLNNVYGSWLNNYVSKKVTGDAHGDVLQVSASVLGFRFNTFEANFIVGEGDVTHEHGVLLSDAGCPSTCAAMDENLFRRNVWFNLAGTHLSTQHEEWGIFNVRNVHDTVVDTLRTAGGATYSALILAGANGYFLNNINDDAWSPGTTTDIRTIFGTTGGVVSGMDYNLAYKSGVTLTFASPWTTQANAQANVNPSFVNRAGSNFTLGAASGAIGTAGPLATTSGSGTGTTFNVVAGRGGFFRGPNNNITQYGGKLTAGDVITVGTDTVTVVSVAKDAVTVTPSFTWADGEPVYYGNDTTPDIGAYPYKAGGYTLSATSAISGATATVTPNDASLVRFVVCYSSGVPYAVDNSSPYTCAAPAGTFSARVYPRYASKTLWVAVQGGMQVTTPSAPKNLKITGY